MPDPERLKQQHTGFDLASAVILMYTSRKAGVFSVTSPYTLVGAPDVG
jgi:hypothetical protein